MSAQSKTKKLLRIDLPLHCLVENESNPNKMSDRAFDLLVDNIERTGLTDAILTRPLDLAGVQAIVKTYKTKEAIETAIVEQAMIFRIVGGHHRYKGAAFIGLETVPVTVIMSDDFDDDAEKFQVVRMNVIHGKMDPAAFLKLYDSLSEAYSDEVMQEAFGFAEEAEFKKLINQMAKSLPDKASQEKFKKAAEEIKTVDGLSKLLNEMFTKYGDTLPHGYMIVDYNGQKSMWLRVESKTYSALEVLAEICIEKNRTVDDVLGGIVQLIAKGELKETVTALIKKTKPANLPANLSVAPTKDNLEKIESI